MSALRKRVENDPNAMVRNPDPAMLRRAFGQFPSGVVALCGVVKGEPVGMAASSFVSVSLDPPLVSVCVRNGSTTWNELRNLETVGISFLTSDHHEACRRLGSGQPDRFAQIDWWRGEGASAFLAGTSVALDCTLERRVPAGDHEIVLLRILSLRQTATSAPLVFHASLLFGLTPQGRDRRQATRALWDATRSSDQHRLF